jgi:hypothetical protein
MATIDDFMTRTAPWSIGDPDPNDPEKQKQHQLLPNDPEARSAKSRYMDEGVFHLGNVDQSDPTGSLSRT